jgi:hypothetical protein
MVAPWLAMVAAENIEFAYPAIGAPASSGWSSFPFRSLSRSNPDWHLAQISKD